MEILCSENVGAYKRKCRCLQKEVANEIQDGYKK